jgi:hypothetical protein
MRIAALIVIAIAGQNNGNTCEYSSLLMIIIPIKETKDLCSQTKDDRPIPSRCSSNSILLPLTNFHISDRTSLQSTTTWSTFLPAQLSLTSATARPTTTAAVGTPTGQRGRAPAGTCPTPGITTRTTIGRAYRHKGLPPLPGVVMSPARTIRLARQGNRGSIEPQTYLLAGLAPLPPARPSTPTPPPTQPPTPA